MKILFIVITLALSSSVLAKLQGQYTFGGFNFGVTSVDSTVNSETNNKSGTTYGLTLGHEFKFSNKFNINLGLEYNKHKLETDLTLPNFSKVFLDSNYTTISLNPTYSIGMVDLGVKADFAVGNDGVLVSQNESSSTLLGLNAFYNMPMKNNKVRFGLAVQRGMSDTSFTQVVGMVQFAFGWTKKAAPMPKRTYIPKKKKAVTTVSFGNNIVHFENDSSEVSFRSKAFLAEIGTFLHSNLDLWDSVEIVGHTSQSGNLDYNKYLSYKRANSVYKIFKEMGVPESKVKLTGMGEKTPLVRNEKTKLDSLKNRRVEMRFNKMKKVEELNRLIKILKRKYKLK